MCLIDYIDPLRHLKGIIQTLQLPSRGLQSPLNKLGFSDCVALGLVLVSAKLHTRGNASITATPALLSDIVLFAPVRLECDLTCQAILPGV